VRTGGDVQRVSADTVAGVHGSGAPNRCTSTPAKACARKRQPGESRNDGEYATLLPVPSWGE
jgi:hypothetical protein